MQETLFIVGAAATTAYCFLCVACLVIDKNSFRPDIVSIPIRMKGHRMIQVVAYVLLACMALALLLLIQVSKSEGLQI